MPRRKKVKTTYDRIPENLNVERIYKAMTDFLLAKQYQPIRLRRKEPFDDSQRIALIEKREGKKLSEENKILLEEEKYDLLLFYDDSINVLMKLQLSHKVLFKDDLASFIIWAEAITKSVTSPYEIDTTWLNHVFIDCRCEACNEEIENSIIEKFETDFEYIIKEAREKADFDRSVEEEYRGMELGVICNDPKERINEFIDTFNYQIIT